MVARYLAMIFVMLLLDGTGGALQVGAQTTKEIVRRVVEGIWNQGRMELAEEIFAPGFVNHDPNPGAVDDLDGFKEWVGRWRSGFPDMRVEIHDLVAEEDRVGRASPQRALTGGNSSASQPREFRSR
jgi:predicted SnoaL-like aldol condensation-catalyzing enzyme